MYEQIQKLPRSFWLTQDKKVQLIFKDSKGLTMVVVREYGKTNTEHMYLLLSTLESDIFAFDTPNGRFTIGISSTGEELFLSPLGVFLYPFGQERCNPQNMSINRTEAPEVNASDFLKVN